LFSFFLSSGVGFPLYTYMSLRFYFGLDSLLFYSHLMGWIPSYLYSRYSPVFSMASLPHISFDLRDTA
jgi:cyanate permease